MIKEIKMKINIRELSKEEKIILYIETHRGEIKDTYYDKIKLKELKEEFVANEIYKHGETDHVISLANKTFNKYITEVEERLNKETIELDKSYKEAMSKLSDKGKSFLFKLEDRNNLR